MALEYDHDALVKQTALRLESDERFALVKYFIFCNDTKTDLIGPYYPDITALRRQGKSKFMIEVQTPYSFEDPDEVRRLESLSNFCQVNKWEFFLLCADEKTRELTKQKIDGRNIKAKEIWIENELPFAQFKSSLDDVLD